MIDQYQQVWIVTLSTPPILLLLFNRPHETQVLYDALRLVEPEKLFIAADGPREGYKEEDRCKQVREIFAHIPWQCEVQTLYRDKHVGLEKGLGEAIGWFFDQVESGIVLEDDCIPEKSFFDFCATMLDRYRDDESIMSINGSSFLPTSLQRSDYYYHSKYVHFWGWASWARAWKQYEPTMKDWPEFKKSADYLAQFGSRLERAYFTMLFDATFAGKTNSWGYRWLYSIWRVGGGSVCPGVNLIRNIGFTKDATHKVLRKFELPTQSIQPCPQLADEAFILQANRETQRRYYAISPFMVLALKIYHFLKS